MIMKPIPGYDGYFADTDGNIWSNKRGELKKRRTQTDRYGYKKLSVTRRGDPHIEKKLVHSWILLAHTGEANGRECNHKNGKRSDNRLSNLEWVDRIDNARHRLEVLKSYYRGQTNVMSKRLDTFENCFHF